MIPVIRKVIHNPLELLKRMMNHNQLIYEDEIKKIPYSDFELIEGYIGFTKADMKALSILIQRINAKNCAEIGTFLGTGSTTVFGALQADLVCVDHWKGNEHDTFMQRISPDNDLFNLCKRNVERFDHQKKISLVNSDSAEAADSYPDGYFDLVFVDADHTYEGCKRDILAWKSKVRKGGIICGHDSEGVMRDFPNVDFSTEALKGVDYLEKERIHPGVIRAVEEIFKGKASLFIKKPVIVTNGLEFCSTIWHHRT